MLAGDRYLATGNWRDCGAPIGQAGNGTAMRMAFLGLCLKNEAQLKSAAIEIARLTHKDPRSVAGGVVVSELARRLVYEPEVISSHSTSSRSISEQIITGLSEAIQDIDKGFSQALLKLTDLPGAPKIDEVFTAESLVPVTTQILSISDDPHKDCGAITPYIVPTVLATTWIILNYGHSWESAVKVALFLGGDVDTLGSIVGATVGAALGLESIPNHLRADIQERERLISLARQLQNLFGD